MNYSKFSGQFVCKMAMLLAFVFAACSENNAPVAGGTVEETGVYALSGRVGNVYPKLLAKVADGSANVQNDESSLFAAKGTVVTIYELDSSSLAATGRMFVDTIDNDEGTFAFDNLSLHSPYVLIETLDSCITRNCVERGAVSYLSDVPLRFKADGEAYVDSSKKYPVVLNAIVDLKKHKKISVNMLSDRKVRLVQAYFAEGISFAEASKKAERDVLENIGVYENLGNFEDLENENEELNYARALYLQLSEMDNWSPLIDETEKLQYFVDDFAWVYENVYNIPSSVFDAMSETEKQYYLNTKKLFGYELGYLAYKAGLGQCTETREDELVLISIPEIENIPVSTVVCRAGKWGLDSKKVEYVKGSMVDNRDGKTYKTVTYNWGNVTQTWMAENLNFADTVSANVDSTLKANLLGKTRCWEYDPSCELFGRYYDWAAAMNVDEASVELKSIVSRTVHDTVHHSMTSYSDTVVVEERCRKAKLIVNVEDGEEDGVEYCSLWSVSHECLSVDTSETLFDYCSYMYKTCYLNRSSVIRQSESLTHQGVCPDGWRIPNKEDWELLSENMKSRGISFDDSYGSGFGDVEPKVTKSYGSDVSRTSVVKKGNETFASIPDENGDGLLAGFSDGGLFMFGKIQFDFFAKNRLRPNYEFAVRCIKN